MEFPLGFPDRLKPRAEAAVLKACRKFPKSEQMPQRMFAGIAAFAEIVIDATKAGEIELEMAHWLLKEFPRDLFAYDPLGAPIRDFSFGNTIFFNIVTEIQRSPRWIRWMERLDAVTREGQRKAGANVPTKRERLTSTIHSPNAVIRIEKYLQDRGIGVTEFANKAGTTDRTIRSFRKTGKIRRSILAGIAKAMGITTDQLLAD